MIGAFLKDSEAEPNMRTASTVAAQQCGREPDAYEVRCTDGNYEWRRPYHGELEVIMRTGKDRSGKPFEYRALFADAPTVAAQQCGRPEGLDATDMDMIRRGDMLGPMLGARVASLIQSQAARIAELEVALVRLTRTNPQPVARDYEAARALLKRRSEG